MTLRIINGSRKSMPAGKSTYERLTASVKRISSEIHFKSLQNSACRFVKASGAKTDGSLSGKNPQEAIAALNLFTNAVNELSDDLDELLSEYSAGNTGYAKMLFRAMRLTSLKKVGQVDSVWGARLTEKALALDKLDLTSGAASQSINEAVDILSYAKERLDYNIKTNSLLATRMTVAAENKNAASPQAGPETLKRLAARRG